LTSKISKEVNFEVKRLETVPVDINSLTKVYQYFVIESSDLKNDELKNIKVTFSVPKGWFSTNNYNKDSLVLYTLKDDQWQMLSTKVVMVNDNEVIYESNAKEFSYYAISLIEKDSSRNITLSFFLIITFIGLLIVYYLLARKE
tara:strand:- start:1089 stop:1520 length:432 start_codon:yes stop_codon:yes gene_type:complete